MPNQFLVPQFLDVESKVIGPITVRQFLIMIVAVFFIFISYKLTSGALFVVLVVLEAGIAGLFSFYKVNGQPFHFFLINYLQTSKRPKVRMWGKEYDDSELRLFIAQKPSVVVVKPPAMSRPSESRLAQLSLVVNTGGAYTADEDRTEKPIT